MSVDRMKVFSDSSGFHVWVTKGLDGWWICERNGHRVKSPELPPRRTREECERDLEAYASKKGWRLT